MAAMRQYGQGPATTGTKKPVFKLRNGSVSVSVWENKGKSKTGDEVSFYNLGIQRSYTDDAGEWKNTENISVGDIPKLTSLLEEIYKKYSIKEQVIE